MQNHQLPALFAEIALQDAIIIQLNTNTLNSDRKRQGICILFLPSAFMPRALPLPGYDELKSAIKNYFNFQK